MIFDKGVRLLNGERIIFSGKCAETIGHSEKREPWHMPHTLGKKIKMFHSPQCKMTIVKVLEEHMG